MKRQHSPYLEQREIRLLRQFKRIYTDSETKTAWTQWLMQSFSSDSRGSSVNMRQHISPSTTAGACRQTPTPPHVKDTNQFSSRSQVCTLERHCLQTNMVLLAYSPPKCCTSVSGTCSYCCFLLDFISFKIQVVSQLPPSVLELRIERGEHTFYSAVRPVLHLEMYCSNQKTLPLHLQKNLQFQQTVLSFQCSLQVIS